MKEKSKELAETQRLLKVVHELRTKCPWDKKQTHKSLARYLLEESYEAVEAIEGHGESSLKEELGDVLLQVVLHSEIAKQKGAFSFADVAKQIADKMIRRHPHIYEKATVKNLKAHQKNWTRLKAKEKPNQSMLGGIPRALPALQLSQRYGEIAASVGFDWQSSEQVYKKVKEELKEFEAEVSRKTKRKKDLQMELGDLFFTLANLARHLHLDAEGAARKSAYKFADCFSEMEKRGKATGKTLADCDAAELERMWEEVKRKPL